ncbi:hypothetical protein I553_6538 [Mycobacterium xenopi 4042]|uniref:Uncharacterized protein n=1 Tax=Mycobacterium xenopi 4042 TaxID=1299334 RepID=X8BHF9_MYCXE|nr:hypothetical protein I552_6251 [Mycobacterium xenopi 3993]EUA42678.1 hypothetical protein I553_6538 [Mycobacterium xenopi 4042]
MRTVLSTTPMNYLLAGYRLRDTDPTDSRSAKSAGTPP